MSDKGSVGAARGLSKPRVVDPDNEFGPEILAKEIVAVSEAAKKLLATRLKKRALLLLLKDACGVSMADIEKVLDAAESLRETYVK